jgi:hypothetical protein
MFCNRASSSFFSSFATRASIKLILFFFFSHHTQHRAEQQRAPVPSISAAGHRTVSTHHALNIHCAIILAKSLYCSYRQL